MKERYEIEWAGVPDPQVGPAAFRRIQGRVGVALGVASVPAALILNAVAGTDVLLVFDALWVAAAVSQLPLGRQRWDWLARLAILVYAVSFALPAGTPDSGSTTAPSQLIGYQAFGVLPVGPIKALPPGGFMAVVIAAAAWLANPTFVVALVLFRLRDATVSLVVALGSLAFGLLVLPVILPGIGHAAWLAAPVILAGAAAWARTHW